MREATNHKDSLISNKDRNCGETCGIINAINRIDRQLNQTGTVKKVKDMEEYSGLAYNKISDIFS